MRKLPLIARILLGLIFFVFGLNGFLNFIPIPPNLPEKLQAVSKPIGELAEQMNADLPDGAEKSAGLRKLLEAKDCFVRAAL